MIAGDKWLNKPDNYCNELFHVWDQTHLVYLPWVFDTPDMAQAYIDKLDDEGVEYIIMSALHHKVVEHCEETDAYYTRTIVELP